MSPPCGSAFKEAVDLFPQASASSPLFCLFQNEKCHLLVEHETQKLKALDESHSQTLKEWRDKLRPRKKVLHWARSWVSAWGI